MKPNNIKYVYIVVLIAFLLRLLVGFAFFPDFKHGGAEKWRDDWAYVGYSRSILNLDFINNPDKIEQEYPDIPNDGKRNVPPGYPILLAILFKISSSLKSVVFLNALLGAITALFIFKITEMLTKHRFYPLLASLWFAVYSFDLRFSYRALKEPFVAFLIIYIVYVVCREFKSRWSKPVLLSLLLSILIHSDERYVMAIPFLFLSLLIMYKKKGWYLVLISTMLIAVLSTPWFIRNLQYYNRPVIITERTAGFTDKLLGYKRERIGKPGWYSDMRLNKAELDSIRMGYEMSGVSEESQNYLRAAMDIGLQPHSFSRMEKIYHNTIELWRVARFQPSLYSAGYAYEAGRSLKHNLATILQFGLLLPFFFCGIVWGLIERRSPIIISLSIIFANWFIHAVLTFGIERYRNPIDPLIMVIAAFGLYKLLDTLSHRERKKSPKKIKQKAVTEE